MKGFKELRNEVLWWLFTVPSLPWLLGPKQLFRLLSTLERWLLPVYSGEMGADIFSPGNRISRCPCSAETPPCPVGRRRPAPWLSEGAHGKEFTEVRRVEGRGGVTRELRLCMWSSPKNSMRGSRCPWVSGSGSSGVRAGRGSKRQSVVAPPSVVGAPLGSDLRDACGQW